MKTSTNQMSFNDIKGLGEHEVQALYEQGKITMEIVGEYFLKTPIHNRVFTNNSVYGALKPSGEAQS